MREYRSIGLMSGTSMDGIDIALLETDGESVVRAGPWTTQPYPADLRHALLKLAVEDPDLAHFEQRVTQAHIEAVRVFSRDYNIALSTVDCVGFHGQTIRHEPQLARTWQLGDGARMAEALGCVVINRFRDADLRQGGQGAPLAPAYHRVLAKTQGLLEPIAILNIGGVSNVTLICGEEIYAFDCGPGNALLDDWVSARAGVPFDEGGGIAARGRVDEHTLSRLMNDPYFTVAGAKSLDRNHFSNASVSDLSIVDGAATLVAFTARAIAVAARTFPMTAHTWIVVGGGRLNTTLVDALRTELNARVMIAEDIGWAGDAIEAQAFAYLAVRSLLGLPLSWPATTGVRQPTTGGVRHDPPS
jgi:anhydro-N-acetylmuramic acid kinase